ncbi:MAG: TetR/AcrR family transcriptional regulator [Planctomycetota bacterium]|jgi:AcrR family transcriptional regulator
MRVTKKTKEKTRKSIIDTARKLFTKKGFEESTTRDIAAGAGIAAGTLFNYFPSKENLGMEIIAEVLEQARDDFEKLRRGEESLAEDLFLYVVTGLNRLEPHRKYLASVVETALSPFTGSAINEAGERVRITHLEEVAAILDAHHMTDQPSFVAAHMYWALYLGVLAFWSQDTSPNQEDTLVLLDQSMRIFTASLAANQAKTPG